MKAYLGLHILPFFELVGCENGFQLRRCVFADGLHFGHLIFARKAGVLAKLAHFFPLIFENRFNLWFLVVSQVELFDNAVEATLASYAWSAGRWSARWRCGGWIVCGVTRIRNRAERQQTADSQRREEQSFCGFHGFNLWFLFLLLIAMS